MPEPRDLDAYRGVTAVVFGASGFIGRCVARMLYRQGARVVAVMRVPPASRLPFPFHLADLSAPGSASTLLRKVKPLIVFNLAGYGVDPAEREEAQARRLNCDLVAEIAESLDAARSWSGQALIHAGSALEFGTVSGNLADPWNCTPTTIYGLTKLEGSARLRDITQRRGIKSLCARLFTVYGPGELPGRLLPTLCAAAASGDQPLALTAGGQSRDFTYVEDVAEGLLRLGIFGEHYPPRALNLATGCLTTVKDFVRRAAAVLGLADARLRFGALASRPEEMSHLPVAISELERIVHWKPRVSIEDGVRRTIAASRESASDPAW